MTRPSVAGPMAWAVLSPGDLGAGFGALLRELGHRVVTTLEGRSDETRRRTERAGLEILPGLRDVIATADVVVSLVPPAAALPLARRYASERSVTVSTRPRSSSRGGATGKSAKKTNPSRPDANIAFRSRW